MRKVKWEENLSEGNRTNDTIYNTDELIRLLKVSRRTVQNWRDEGQIEFSQINGKIYYRQTAIDRMLDRNLVNSNSIK